MLPGLTALMSACSETRNSDPGVADPGFEILWDRDGSFTSPLSGRDLLPAHR